MSSFTSRLTRDQIGKGLPKPKIKKRISGFDIGKQMIGMPVGDTPVIDVEDEPEILCINCLDRISEEVIEAHRKVCKSYSKLDLNSESALESISQNIEKLHDFLVSKERQSSGSDSTVILMLMRKCSLLLENSNFSQTSEIIKSLESFLVNFRGTISLKIYLERVLSLARDQEKVLQNINIESKLRKIEQMKRGIKKFEKKPSPPGKFNLNINFQKLEVIHSQVTSKYGSSGKFSESAIEEPNCSEGNFGEQTQTSDGDFQKYFYSLCITHKMEFSASDPAQSVSISKLFADAKSKDIPPEQWGSFINSELRNPANWEKHRSRQRRPGRKKLAFVETILEED